MSAISRLTGTFAIRLIGDCTMSCCLLALVHVIPRTTSKQGKVDRGTGRTGEATNLPPMEEHLLAWMFYARLPVGLEDAVKLVGQPKSFRV